MLLVDQPKDHPQIETPKSLYYSGLGTVRFLWQVDIIVCSKALVAIITVGTGGLWSVRRGVVVHSEDLSLVAVVAVVC